MNLLVSSVGRRVQLITYLKQELGKIGGQVIAIDCDQTAPALYHADIYEIVPRIDAPDYVAYLKRLCKKYKIKGIISLIDPELTILAGHKQEFEQEGITAIVSNKSVIEICYDKFLTSKFLQSCQIPVVPTYLDISLVKKDVDHGKLNFPLLVKPRRGSASIGVQKMNDMKELSFFLEQNQDYIIQPWMQGDEYVVECYIDLISREITSMFCKRKLNMRAGETDKSIVIRDEELEKVTKNIMDGLQLIGPIDIDYFKSEKGYLVSEINPRFGGGYPYAHQMGHNFIQHIINNLNGHINPPYREYWGEYAEGETMARYDQFVVLR